MRCSPKRIVLAALAFVVGAVLALPMLLARKAEAGGAPPKLEAVAGADWALTAGEEGPAHQNVEGEECNAEAAHSGACPPAPLVEARDPGSPLPVFSPHPEATAPEPTDRLAYVVASPVQAPWPHPNTIDRQRKYHLRP